MIAEVLGLVLGLIDKENSLCDLFMYVSYCFMFSHLICMLIMAMYAIALHTLPLEVGAWVAVYAAMVTLFMGQYTTRFGRRTGWTWNISSSRK